MCKTNQVLVGRCGECGAIISACCVDLCDAEILGNDVKSLAQAGLVVGLEDAPVIMHGCKHTENTGDGAD